MINDTICAISTPLGVGGISIVRISGVLALDVAKHITSRDSFIPRYATLCKIKDSNLRLIDEAIVIYFKSPNSYTCEDVIEIQCHGGMISSKLILDELVKRGVRIAKPGEFTKRAVLNGRIDLTKAEAAAKLIESKSIDAAKILARQLNGELKEFVDKIRDDLVEILAYVEVNIDYAEEDLPKNLIDDIQLKLEKLQKLLQNSLDISKSREGLFDGYKVAIVGKPNVGKSSLLNTLLKYDRAIISDIAGTTRDTVEESIRVGSHLVKFVDTAGIRESGEIIEQIGIKRSIKAIKESDIVIALFDGSKVIDKDDEKIIELLNEYKSDKKIITVINKNDLKQYFDFGRIKEFNPIKISIKRTSKEIVNALKDILDKNSGSYDDMFLINKRQIDAVTNSLNAIKESKQMIYDGELELFAFEINEAIKFISSITHAFERDEILDKMFGSFCLGK